MIAKISSSANLVGALGYNFPKETIEQKIFHAEIIVDVAKVTAEAKAYQPIPIIAEFLNEDGFDSLAETIEANYKCVKQDILSLVASEIERIKNAPILRQLIREWYVSFFDNTYLGLSTHLWNKTASSEISDYLDLTFFHGIIYDLI